MPRETFTLMITGIRSEAELLALTRALLKIRRERGRAKPAWRALELRPFALTDDQAAELIGQHPPVIDHDDLAGMWTDRPQPQRQLTEPRPTLKRLR